MEYNREWEYGTPSDCDCQNNFIQVDCGCKPKDVCECENILLEISKLKSEDIVLQREIDAISGASISGVTEEEVDAKIAEAKTEIEDEIPSLSGYATEQWVEDKHYITGVDLSDYATTEQMNNAITAATDGLATEEYVNAQISSQTSDFVTGVELSSYTYDKVTIDEKIAGGGIFDPTQYFNTAQTINLVESAVTRVEGEIPTVPTSNTAFTNDAGYLTEHQSLSGYATEQWVEDKHYITGVDLSNYATKAEIPVVPTDISAFNNDVGYITGVDLSNYATKDNLTAATDDMATKTWVGQQGYLTEHQSLTAYSTTEQVNSAITQAVSGKQDTLVSSVNIKTINNESLLGSGNITIQGGGGTDAPISAGTGTNALIENYTGNTASGDYSHAEGTVTRATGNTSHAEGHNSYAYGQYSHAEGDTTTASNDSAHAEGRKTVASGRYSHAEGSYTTADTLYAHSEGYTTVASGQTSHAEGYMTHANGNTSHSEGSATYANGGQSHAEGLHTETNNVAEHASGMYNVSHTGNTTATSTLFSVGNGDENTRRNAFEIRQNGDIYIRKNNTDVRLQDITPGIWCGTMAEYQQISGSTDNNTIYLIHS